MRKISEELKEDILQDPYYEKCARQKDGSCDGRITFEHSIIFKGSQLNEKYAIIPLCEYHHAVNQYQDGGDLNKEINECISLNRATKSELQAISKAIDYTHRLNYLNNKYDNSYR